MNTKEPIDSLLERLAKQEPILSNPEELTDRIMEALEKEERPRVEKEGGPILTIWKGLRLVTHAAACLLIGLFLWQQFPDPEVKQENTPPTPSAHIINRYSNITDQASLLDVLAKSNVRKEEKKALRQTIQRML